MLQHINRNSLKLHIMSLPPAELPCHIEMTSEAQYKYFTNKTPESEIEFIEDLNRIFYSMTQLCK